MSFFNCRLLPALLLAVTVAALYSLGLSGPFLFDDQQNILLNTAVQPAALTLESLRAAWLGNESGPLGRPIASLSFALDFLAYGLNPAGYKASNIALHLASGAALYGFLLTLLRAATLAGRWRSSTPPTIVAGFAAALWLLHPLQVSTVLYVVQRMAILAALFSFIGLWAYAYGRLAQLKGVRGWPWLLLAMPLATAAAALSKENGLLLPLLCGACEWTLLGLKAEQSRSERLLRAVYVSLLAAGLLALLLIGPDLWRHLVSGFGGRPFSMEERLLTEARVLWWYLGLLLAPDLGAMNLYHDDFALSTHWLQPFSTLPAVIGWGLAVSASLLFAARLPLLAFALLFYLVGHVLESSVVPLELIFEHRNYGPSAGWALLAAAALAQLAETRKRLALGIAALLLTVFAGLLGLRSHVFGDEFRLLTHSLQYHPGSVRTQLWAADAYKVFSNRAAPEQKTPLRERALVHYREATRIDPTETIGLFEELIWNADQNQPLDPVAEAELLRRLRTLPPKAGSVVASRELASTITHANGNFPAETMRRLLEALHDNPQLGNDRRALVLSSIADLYWLHGNAEVALGLRRAAEDLDSSNAYLPLFRARTALAAEQYAEAEEALAQARTLDGGHLRAELDQLAADLAAARKTSPIAPSPALP